MSPWVSVGVQIACSGVLGLYIATTTIEERKGHLRSLKRFKGWAGLIAVALGSVAIQTWCLVSEVKSKKPMTRVSVLIISTAIVFIVLQVLWFAWSVVSHLYSNIGKSYRSLQNEQLNLLANQIGVIYKHLQRHEDVLFPNERAADETTMSEQVAAPQQIGSTTQISEAEQK